MNKKKIGEKTDSLLEAEMIKEAKMIEESLLGNAANDFEISDEELDEAYQQFLKKMEAEGKLDEDKINEANSAKAMNNDTKTAEIVKFPGFRNEASKEENLKDAQSTESSAEEIDFIAGFSDKLRQFEKEENKPWYKYGKAAGIAVLAAIGILAFRRVGTYHPEAYAYKYLNLVHFWMNLLKPFTVSVTWIARLAAVPFGVEINRTEKSVTEEEIISIVDEAHEQGVIQENEAEMIQNIISFNETEAHDIMTHRKNVVAFDEEILLKNMIDTMLEEGNSRYPVYEENIDNIKGIVHYKDALKFMTQNPWAKFKPLKELPGIIRQASLIPETRGIGDLFHTMQARKIHMAIVVDEYGQTAGIVTMEDILEEIVGDILDEYDEDEITIRAQKDNSLIIDGLAYLEDVEEELDADFGDTEFETLNGYLTNILGHIPADKDVNTSIKAIGYCFTILSIGNKTIGKVKVERDNNVAV